MNFQFNKSCCMYCNSILLPLSSIWRYCPNHQEYVAFSNGNTNTINIYDSEHNPTFRIDHCSAFSLNRKSALFQYQNTNIIRGSYYLSKDDHSKFICYLPDDLLYNNSPTNIIKIAKRYLNLKAFL